MEPNTIRLPANTWTELADEADDLGFHSRSAYLRWILSNRDVIEENTEPNTPPNTVRTQPNTEANTPDYEALVERIGELEQRVDSTPSEKAPGAPRETPLESVEFPSGRDRPACEAATLAARDYLRENGGASMSEIVVDVMPDHPVGYDAEQDVERINDPDERNRSTWWRRVVKPGFEALPDVEAPARGASEWRCTGE